MTPELLLEALLNSKRPRIFAESEIAGDGSDWTAEELGLLGDIGIAVPVTIYDDGRHRDPAIHEPPFDGTLLFVPGALLRADGGTTPADWDEVVSNGAIDQEAYTALYERRLVPLLAYASARAVAANRQALVTIPGLGCGQFAGRFRGSMGTHLRDAIRVILERHVSELPGIRAVWYDPYGECEDERHEIGSVSYLVRPLQRSERGRPQLCRPTVYEEQRTTHRRTSQPGRNLFASTGCASGLGELRSSSTAASRYRVDESAEGREPPILEQILGRLVHLHVALA